MAYQTPDSKKEEFRKYLEKSGVIDALTKVLVGLYEEPERPPNAVDYIKRYMGAPTGIDVDALRQENEDLKKELRDCLAGKQKLEEENQDRKDEIAVLEKLLQAERAAAASNASRKKKGLFGRK